MVKSSDLIINRNKFMSDLDLNKFDLLVKKIYIKTKYSKKVFFNNKKSNNEKIQVGDIYENNISNRFFWIYRSNLCKRLLEEEQKIKIIGLDNMNDYYDVSLKEYKFNNLSKYDNYTFIKGNLSDKELINKIFEEYKPSTTLREGLRQFAKWYKEYYMKTSIFQKFLICKKLLISI